MCASAAIGRSGRGGGFGASSSAVGVTVGGRAAAGAESALFFAEDAVVIGVHPVEDGARAVVGGVAAHRLRLLRVAFAHHLVDGLQHSTHHNSRSSRVLSATRQCISHYAYV